MRSTGLLIPIVVLVAILVCLGSVIVVAGLVIPLNLTGIGAVLSTPQAANPSAADALPELPGAPRTGEAAPDFTLGSLALNQVQLSQQKGKGVILNFWATWCAPCSAEMPNLQKTFEQHQSGDIVILAVNQLETPEQVQGYADLYRLHFPFLLDSKGEVSHIYRVQALPTTFFIDRTGIIREIHIGGPMSLDFIEGRIQALFK